MCIRDSFLSDEQRASTQSNELAKLGKLRREYCIRVTLNRCIAEVVNILCLVTFEGVLKTFKYAQPLDKNLTPYRSRDLTQIDIFSFSIHVDYCQKNSKGRIFLINILGYLVSHPS